MNIELAGRGHRTLHVFDSTLVKDNVVVAIHGPRHQAAMQLDGAGRA